MDSMPDTFQLATYIINLPERNDRLINVEREFIDKNVFDVHIFNAVRRRRGATGLWRSIVGIVTEAKSRGCDAVLICEDDHTFTYAYNENRFINDVFRAAEYGAQLLLGGIGNFHNAVPVDDGMMWVDCFLAYAVHDSVQYGIR